MAIVEKQGGKWRWSLAARSYLLATGGGVLAFLPWLLLLLHSLTQVNEATSATTRSFPFGYLLDQWFLNLNRVFINGELYSFNLVLVLLASYALFFLCRQTLQRIWLFVLAIFQLVATPRQLKIPQGFDAVFLLNPSRRLRSALTRQGYPQLLLCQDEAEKPGDPQARLWLVRQKAGVTLE